MNRGAGGENNKAISEEALLHDYIAPGMEATRTRGRPRNNKCNHHKYHRQKKEGWVRGGEENERSSVVLRRTRYSGFNHPEGPSRVLCSHTKLLAPRKQTEPVGPKLSIY